MISSRYSTLMGQTSDIVAHTLLGVVPTDTIEIQWQRHHAANPSC
jgi:hypothetical protein